MADDNPSQTSFFTQDSLRKFAIDQARISAWEYKIGREDVFLDKLTLEHFDIDGDSDFYPFALLVEKIHPEDRQRILDAVERTVSGQSDQYNEDFRIVTRDGASKWLRGVGRIMTSVIDGESPCLIGVSYEITEAKQQEMALVAANNQISLMAEELNHRVKNLFSIMSFLITQSAEGADTAKEAMKKARDRVIALSRAHALSNVFDAEAAFSLDALLRDILLPYPVREGQVEISGPDVSLRAETLTSLGLIFHELATNSVKYGALSDPSRFLSVDWSQSETEVHLKWTERGLGAINEKPVEGFGSKAIHLSGLQLGASLSRVFSSDSKSAQGSAKGSEKGGEMVFTMTFPKDLKAQSIS